MLFRVLAFVGFLCLVSSCKGMEVAPNENAANYSSMPSKRALPKPDLYSTPDFSSAKEPPLKRAQPSPTSKEPLLKRAQPSPTSKERQYWSPIRREMAKKKYARGRRSAVSSPFVRSTYRQCDRGNFFVRREFQGRIVLQADQLFDPHAKVLSKKGNWDTNLARMERGLSPIGYRGIASEFERQNRAQEAIRAIQKRWRIELQHVTQRDSKTAQDPICEMTHSAHLGHNARLVLKLDSATKETLIIHSSLEKEDALTLLEEEEDLFMVANVLHFRQGGSLIDRSDFSAWRKGYWENRAKELREETQTPRHFSTVFPSPLNLRE